MCAFPPLDLQPLAQNLAWGMNSGSICGMAKWTRLPAGLGLERKFMLVLSLWMWEMPAKVQFLGTAKRWQNDSANSHFPASKGETDPAWELDSCQKLKDLGSSLLPPHCSAQSTTHHMCSKIFVGRWQLFFQQRFLFSLFFFQYKLSFNKYLLSTCYVDPEATVMSKADLVSALSELTSSRGHHGHETNKCTHYGAGLPTLVQQNREILDVSLELMSNYIFTHPHESPSLKKERIPWLYKVFQGRESVKHTKV